MFKEREMLEYSWLPIITPFSIDLTDSFRILILKISSMNTSHKWVMIIIETLFFAEVK